MGSTKSQCIIKALGEDHDKILKIWQNNLSTASAHTLPGHTEVVQPGNTEEINAVLAQPEIDCEIVMEEGDEDGSASCEAARMHDDCMEGVVIEMSEFSNG